MRRCLFAAVLIAGCQEHGRSPGVDASSDGPVVVDAPRPRNDPGMGPIQQPFDATFVTPAGTFDAHVLFAQATWGDCDPPVWDLRFTTTENGQQPSVTLHVTLPRYTGVEVAGTMAASAFYESAGPVASHSTMNVTFQATRIDYPWDGAPRITGRFVDTDPAWTIDLPLDVLGFSAGCI